jgi:hypothetical protein
MRAPTASTIRKIRFTASALLVLGEDVFGERGPGVTDICSPILA